jgi:uncharacterized protein
MNLFESDVALRPTTGPHHDQSVLQFAEQEQIAVLVNRPLNAMPGSGVGMLRLADFPVEGEPGSLEDAFRAVGVLEDEYRSTFGSVIPHGGEGLEPKDYFNWARELAPLRTRLQGLEHWEQIEHQMVAPHVNQVLQAIPRVLRGTSAEQNWEGWRDRYVPQLLVLLGLLRRTAAEKSRARTQEVAASIDPLLPESTRKESMSRKALWVVVSTPGVTCVLNGMRTTQYVDDSTAILGWNRLSDPKAVYKATAKLVAL